MYIVIQRQAAVTAYLKSKLLLLFVFSLHCIPPVDGTVTRISIEERAARGLTRDYALILV